MSYLISYDQRKGEGAIPRDCIYQFIICHYETFILNVFKAQWHCCIPLPCTAGNGGQDSVCKL